MKKLNKKLTLNKQTIARLDGEQQISIFGGYDPSNIISCTTNITKDINCPTNEGIKTLGCFITIKGESCTCPPPPTDTCPTNGGINSLGCY